MMHAAKAGVDASESSTLELTHDELEALLKQLGGDPHVQLRDKCAHALAESKSGKAHLACNQADLVALRQLTSAAKSGPLAKLHERLPGMHCGVDSTGGGPIVQGHTPGQPNRIV
jgi:hypothetical protein